jgi:hypothetical protein
MSTTILLLLIVLALLIATFIAAVLDYRRVCRRSEARFAERTPKR